MDRELQKWAKAGFTVEAAVIVPMIVIITALLIGFCYYTHQINWCKGASYEAVIKGVERVRKEDDSQRCAQHRINERIAETPLSAGIISADAASGYRVGIQFKGGVLEEVFHGLFQFRGEASIVRFEPVKIKRTAYLIKGIAGGSE